MDGSRHMKDHGRLHRSHIRQRTRGYQQNVDEVDRGVTTLYGEQGPFLRKIHHRSPPENEKIQEAPIVSGGLLGEWVRVTQKQTWEFVNLNSGWWKEAFFSPSRSLRVYCNVGQSVVVGNQMMDLLHEVRIKDSIRDTVYFEPMHLLV